MFRAIKNHIIDVIVDFSHKEWVTSNCFFIERALIKGKGLNMGKKFINNILPLDPYKLDANLEKIVKCKREKIKHVYTASYKQIEHNVKPCAYTSEEQKQSIIEEKKKEVKNRFKSGVFKLVTETGKNIYFNARYLGFILYQIGVKEDYLLKYSVYYSENNLLLIYSRGYNLILAGISRFDFDYTDDLLYPKLDNNSTDYAGIDYGRGQSNINTKTGLRFGCIGQGQVGQAWFDSSEPYYPCKDCEYRRKKDKDFYCDYCEASSWYYKDKEYLLESVMDNTDIMVFKSPYFTYAQYCSPCLPGACNLESPLVRPEQDNKCYCLGHDWFEEGKAPYPVFDAKTGQIVNPKQ